MTKLLALLLLIPVWLRFRFRRNPRIKGRVFPWYFAFVAAVMLLVSPWELASGTAEQVIAFARLVASLLLVLFLVFDIRRALR